LLAAFGITQALIAQKQTKVAEDRRQEAETQKRRAVDAAERADSARIVADSAFQVARQREVEANTERQKAEANAQEARKNLLLANKNEEEANKQRDKAQENARKLEKEKATVEARELELKDRNERILSLNDSINQAFLEVAQQQAIAQGNFLKSEALLTLQSGDPSKAFRVAEYAWKKEKERPVIYPPFLNIYYSGKSFYYLKSFCTNPFYQIDYQGNQNIARAIFSPDDQQSLILFQEAQHALLRSSTADIHLEHESNVSSLCFSNSGKYIATGDEEGAIHIWRKDGRKTETLKRHQGEITDLAFLNEEQYLISTGDDQRILLWDLEDAQTKPSMLKLPRMRRGFQQLAVSPKGDYIAAITDKDLFLFKRRTKLLYQLKKVKLFKVNQVFQDIQFTPDGKELYLFTREAIRYIDIDNLKEKDIFTFSADISSAELDPSGNFLLLTFIRSKVMELFDLTKKESIARLQGHNGWVRSAVFSGDGTLALSSSDDNTVRIWQLNGKKIPHFVGKEQLPYRQGTSEYSFSYQNDSISIRKKGVAEAYWKVKRKLTSDSKVIVSPNGEAMIILSRNSSIASLWRRTGGSEILRGHSGNLTAASFTSTGALLATASDKGEVILWDSAANRLHQLSPGNRVENLWFSSDKKHLIVEFPQEQFIAYLISAEGLMEKARELQIPELDQSTLGRLNIE
jgi:WD40 repeat protein